jgi:putative ubiquitin-RnfH superfamily antitoxin RatB of RatAB toxin-antitoxin module
MMAPSDSNSGTRSVTVTVVYAAPGVEALVTVTLPAGATIDDVVAQSGIVTQLALDPAQLECAIYGQRAKGGTPVVDGDRVELTRPLTADPKRARRKRAANQLRPKASPAIEPRD